MTCDGDPTSASEGTSGLEPVESVTRSGFSDDAISGAGSASGQTAPRETRAARSMAISDAADPNSPASSVNRRSGIRPGQSQRTGTASTSPAQSNTNAATPRSAA